MVKGEPSIEKHSCCTQQVGIAIKCQSCGFNTCPLHAAVWTDCKAHCARCFAPLTETPFEGLFTINQGLSLIHRCLLVIDGLYIAGAQKSALSLIYTLRKLGIGTHLLALSGGGQWYDNFLMACDVISISYRTDINWSDIERTKGFVLPNFVSSHLCEPSVWASMQTPPVIPLIAHLHSEISEHEQLTSIQARVLFSRAQYIVVPSSITQEFYVKWARKTLSLEVNEKVCVVPNIVHPAFTKPANHHERNLTDGVTLFAPTRLDRDKLDIDLLFSFIDKLQFHKEINLVIAGDGEYRQTLEDFLSTKQVRLPIHLLGFETDIENRYAIADAIILFSKREAMPMVLLEAILYDLPIIAPKVGVFKSIDTCQGMFLYEVGDVDELFEAMENALRTRFTDVPVYLPSERQKFLDVDGYQSIIGNLYASRGGPSCI